MVINFIKQNKTIIILILGYFVIFSVLSSLRHYTFQTQVWDLAAFEQSFWNTVHGKIMFNNFEGTTHFAIHFSPFLLLLVPFYFIWQSPYTLLIIQSLALALGALPLYLLAKKIINQKWAIAIAATYLLYPSLHWLNLFDFHAVTFAIPLFLAWFYFWEQKKYIPAIIFLALAATTAESMIVAVFVVGLYLLLFNRQQWKWGLAISVISLIYFVLVAKVIMPAFGGGIVRLDRYAQFGASVTEIIKNVILNPALTFETVFIPEKFIYLASIFVSTAFLSFIAWPTLILLGPGLAQNLLTDFSFQFNSFYQYDSILVAFIFVGVVLGIKKLLQTSLPEKIILGIVILFVTLGFIWKSPLSPFNFPLPRFTDQRSQDFKKIVELIPDDVSVAAHTNLVPHLTHRENIYLAGHEPFFVDYVIIDGDDVFGFPDKETFDQYFDQYKKNGQHELVIIENRYFMLKPKSN